MVKAWSALLALVVGSAFADPVKPEDLTVWKLAPRTPWVTDAREIVNLGGPGTDWRMTSAKSVKGEFLKKAGAEDVFRWTDPELDETSAKWEKAELPQANYVSTKWFNDVTWYERTVSLTAAQAARNVRISFEKIGVHYKVWVNGKLAAAEPISSTFLEQHDISPFVKAGENVIRILVGGKKDEDDSWIDWPLNGVKNGILRPFYLEFRDPVAIERVAVRTVLSPAKRMTVAVLVTNTTAKAAVRELKGTVAGTAWSASGKVVLKPGEGRTVELAKDWPDARLWSPVDPYLQTLDLTLAGEGGKDAYRQRFGFREIRWKGTDGKALFNGKPFTMLRNSLAHFGFDRAANKKEIDLLRSRGIVGLRYFSDWFDLPQFCDLCDEEGFLVSTAACSGWGCGFKTEAFFPRWKRMLGKMQDELLNSPSVICWGLSNEFGTNFGGKGPDGKPNQENAVRQGEVGEWVQSRDPTRPWEMYGEIELRWDKEGPMPIRSHHYPFPVTMGVLPQCGRWFANGWTSIKNDKPVSISEDLFHGFQDRHATMAKALVGDRIYTLDGYVEAQWYCLRAYCEGYYLGNIAGWDPWCFYVEREKAAIFDGPRGSPHPNRLLLLKEFNRNVTAGVKTPFTLIAANRGFAPVKGTLVREIRLGDKVVTVSKPVAADVDMGANTPFPFEVEAPSVAKPTPFDLVATWKDAKGAVVARETFAFVAVPRKTASDIRVPGRTAALATRTNAAFAALKFPLGVHQTVGAALAAKPEAIVLYGTLSTYDSQQLDEWVKAGGRVLQLEPAFDDWSVAALAKKQPHPYAFSFRRDDAHMTDLPETAMRLWAPDGLVGDVIFAKPSEDARVLWESVHDGGMRWCEAAWFWRGKGGWLVSTFPALERMGVEPIAGHVLQSVLNELVAPNATAPVKRAVLVDFDGLGSLSDLLQRNKAHVATVKASDRLAKADPAKAVWLVDAKGKPLAPAAKAFVKAMAEKGGTVAVFGLAKETDAAWLSFLGITWEKPREKLMAPIPWFPNKTDEVDTSRHFFTHIGNAGAIAGLNNEDLFWWQTDRMWFYYRFWIGDSHYETAKQAGEPVSAYFESADKATKVLTAPGAIGLKTVGKGRVLFTTFDVGQKGYAGDHPEKAYLTVKTLVNNLGAPLSKILTPGAFEFVDLAPVASAASWRKPGAEKLAFNPRGGVDYRYFPVNRCGWSLTAHNMCPTEAVPSEPLCYNNVYFRFVDPERNGGKDVLFIQKGLTPERVSLKLPKAMKVKKVHFLGFSVWSNGGDLFFGDQAKPVHIGIRDHVANWSDSWDMVKSGVKIYNAPWEPAANGGDKSKPGKAYVYHWSLENPEPDTLIDHLDVANAEHLGIFAVTIEK